MPAERRDLATVDDVPHPCGPIVARRHDQSPTRIEHGAPNCIAVSQETDEWRASRCIPQSCALVLACGHDLTSVRAEGCAEDFVGFLGRRPDLYPLGMTHRRADRHSGTGIPEAGGSVIAGSDDAASGRIERDARHPVGMSVHRRDDSPGRNVENEGAVALPRRDASAVRAEGHVEDLVTLLRWIVAVGEALRRVRRSPRSRDGQRCQRRSSRPTDRRGSRRRGSWVRCPARVSCRLHPKSRTPSLPVVTTRTAPACKDGTLGCVACAPATPCVRARRPLPGGGCRRPGTSSMMLRACSASCRLISDRKPSCDNAAATKALDRAVTC